MTAEHPEACGGLEVCTKGQRSVLRPGQAAPLESFRRLPESCDGKTGGGGWAKEGAPKRENHETNRAIDEQRGDGRGPRGAAKAEGGEMGEQKRMGLSIGRRRRNGCEVRGASEKGVGIDAQQGSCKCAALVEKTLAAQPTLDKSADNADVLRSRTWQANSSAHESVG